MRIGTARGQLWPLFVCLLCGGVSAQAVVKERTSVAPPDVPTHVAAAPLHATAEAAKQLQEAKRCFFDGFAAYEASRYAQAQQLWQACLPVVRATAWHEQTLWYLALLARIQNRPKQAQYRLQQLLREYRQSKKKPKYLFWLGDSLQMQRRHRQAHVAFSLTYNQWPLSYYGLLAHKRQQQLPAAVQMDAAQHSQQALLAQLQAQAAAAYPTPWPKAVRLASKRTGVHTSVAYAVMRKESNFARRARSQAGALGVMQLLHSTAQGIARHTGKKIPSRSDLYAPRRCINLGMQYLRVLKHQFGEPHLVFAAYNAGRGRVAGWLRRFGHLQPELFMERIPYVETREYVRRVLLDQYVYSYVLSCSSQGDTVPFLAKIPAVCSRPKPLLRSPAQQLLQCPYGQSEILFVPGLSTHNDVARHRTGAYCPGVGRQAAKQPFDTKPFDNQSRLRSDSSRSAFGTRRVADQAAAISRFRSPGGLFGGGFHSTHWRSHGQKQDQAAVEPAADRAQLPNISRSGVSGIGPQAHAGAFQFPMAIAAGSG